jgi:hypothetical protein
MQWLLSGFFFSFSYGIIDMGTTWDDKPNDQLDNQNKYEHLPSFFCYKKSKLWLSFTHILGDCLYFPTMCHDYCIWFLFWNLGNMLFVREHGVKYVAPIEITKCSWLMCNKHPLLEKRNVWEWKPVTWALQQYTKHRIRLSKKDRFFKKFNSNDLFKSKKFSRPNPTRIL